MPWLARGTPDAGETDIITKAWSDRWNNCTPAGLLPGMESCWSGAGQYKILAWRDVGTTLKAHWMIWKSEFETYFYTLKNTRMSQPSPTSLPVHLLRESNYIGWIHAISVSWLCGDKAGFHAIAAI